MSNIIEQRRKELKLTQEQLAEKSGVSRSQIANIETGVAKVSYESAKALADALGIKWGDVFESLHGERNSADIEN